MDPTPPPRPDLIQTPPRSGLNENSNFSSCLKSSPPQAQLCLSKSSHQAGSTEGLEHRAGLAVHVVKWNKTWPPEGALETLLASMLAHRDHKGGGWCCLACGC